MLDQLYIEQSLIKLFFGFHILQLQNARSHMESVLEDLQRDIEQIQKQKEGEAGDETLQRKVIELAHNLQGNPQSHH